MAASHIPVKRPRTYVLIHGAWHGGWVWKETATELRYMGHEVYTPSLTGLGDRAHLAHEGITLDTHTDDIVNLIRMEQLNDVVLVGWSYGGMVVSNVLARIPERIGAVMYFDAFVPESGKCLADYAGEKGRVFRERTWPDQRVPPFPLKAFGVTDEKLCERVQKRLVCQPLQTFLQPSKALAERPAIPHSYVMAAAYDGTPFQQFYDKFNHDPGWSVHTLNTGHLAMLTDPVGTFGLLADVAPGFNHVGYAGEVSRR
ncbi:alpha/beta hydrolase [Pusillimonas sp. DMV24BSW_D]|jgi:pimeloyl-ACP methyl ester carboxylesterase|uniref:alpha/beta hydrolase n=1 Tax=Neopusillimonas aestuarii TaxID=2716226 RepID=UPI00140BFD6E|nr:alpha/beta hydrolase [Pusillimonas sp. DMV24BSW_D]QIM49858.1 alpha/beta hydrolase [Pusillimonas sp. DMV24BSW_D]